jgi:preprotein translocase subunit SecE
MSANSEVEKSPLDVLKWLTTIALLAAAIVGYYLYSSEYLLYSVLAAVALFVIAGFVGASTVKGKSFVVMLQEANIERRKVVWPTRQETVQTTLIVVVVVLIMGLILFCVDALLSWGVSSVIG